jgi:hypothetical protein
MVQQSTPAATAPVQATPQPQAAQAPDTTALKSVNVYGRGVVGFKPYRVNPGHKHWYPDLAAQKNAEGVASNSHKLAKGGDICYLSDAQYTSFKHKFTPTDDAPANVK